METGILHQIIYWAKENLSEIERLNLKSIDSIEEYLQLKRVKTYKER